MKNFHCHRIAPCFLFFSVTCGQLNFINFTVWQHTELINDNCSNHYKKVLRVNVVNKIYLKCMNIYTIRRLQHMLSVNVGDLRDLVRVLTTKGSRFSLSLRGDEWLGHLNF